MVDGKICTYCKQPIHWPQPYVQGQKPINPDGTTHICPARTQTITPTVPQRAPVPVPKKESENIELKPADQIVTFNEKITTITLSRTVSYKYGKAKEYATEKEEIMDSFTCGLTVDINTQDSHAIERTVDVNLQEINAALRKEIWHKYKLKLLTGEEYNV